MRLEAAAANPPEEPLRTLAIASSARNPLAIGELAVHIREYFRSNPLPGRGGKPVQIWIHPLLNVDAQPNFAEQEADILWVYDVMKWQSKVGDLDWGGTPAPDFGNTPPK